MGFIRHYPTRIYCIWGTISRGMVREVVWFSVCGVILIWEVTLLGEISKEIDEDESNSFFGEEWVIEDVFLIDGLVRCQN